MTRSFKPLDHSDLKYLTNTTCKEDIYEAGTDKRNHLEAKKSHKIPDSVSLSLFMSSSSK